MKPCNVCYIVKPIEEFWSKKWARCKACDSAHSKVEYYSDLEGSREKSREKIKKYRKDPSKNQGIKLSKRKYYHLAGGKQVIRSRIDQRKISDPFRWKADNRSISKKWLVQTWQSQRGRCALSGRRLDVLTLVIDHIIPKSRGGADHVSNYRLLCPEANSAKSSLLDDEFFKLCREILVFSKKPNRKKDSAQILLFPSSTMC